MTPQQAFQHAQPGFQAYREGRFADAERIADEIVSAAPADPNGRYLKGIALRARRAFPEALDNIEQALAIAPTAQPFMTARGQVLEDMERFTEARDQYRATINKHPNAFEPRFFLGALIQRTLDFEKARKVLGAALQLRPGDGETLFRLAQICRRQRDWPAALDYAEQVLAQAPGDWRALAIAAQADFEAGRHEAVRRRVMGAPEMTRGTADDKRQVLRWLGDSCDALGDKPAAFQAWSSGNAFLRAEAAADFEHDQGPGSLAAAQRVRAFLETLEPQAMPEASAVAPAFLLGFPRSGTTLLEQVLAAHPQIVTSDEAATLAAAKEAAGSTPDSLAAFFQRPPSDLAALGEAYWDVVEHTGAGRDLKGPGLFLDKLPLNLVWLGVIAKLFPNSRVILALRDPRDAVFSAWRRAFSLNPAMYRMLSLQDAAAYYDAAMGAGEAARKLFPDLPVLEVRYEDVVADLEGAARKTIDFFGLDWSDEVLAYREKLAGRQISTPSAPQVEREVTDQAIGKWREYEEALAPVRGVLDPWAERWGYKV